MKQHSVRLEPVGVNIFVNDGTPLHDIIHEYGIEFPCGGKGICGACKVKLLKGNIDLDLHHQSLLQEQGLEGHWRLACLSKVTDDIVLEVQQFESIILADNTIFRFEASAGYGIAIDVGTTTVVAQLINLENGQVVEVQSRLNPQSRFGADIMSRISYALENEGASQLMFMIRECIGEMLSNLIKDKVIDLKKIILVGNTVMHHLFAGIDVNPLSCYPFESSDTGEKHFTATKLNWNVQSSTEIIFMSNIGSFVGSDILAGIYAADIHNSNEYIALIDLGTNGEIVVGNKNHLLCASTAAGPAFEGTNISMGMKATTGAISSIQLENDKLIVHTIGNVTPRGICGSGLIDAVAVLLDKNEIDIAGLISDGREAITISENVSINQKDFREFQLAKAAIAAGIEILMNQLHINSNDISKVYIAGGFGSFITIENVIKLGLLEFPPEKIHKLGNSALIGAKMFLFNTNEQQKILSKSKHYSLESDKNFQDIYVNKMFFIPL